MKKSIVIATKKFSRKLLGVADPRHITKKAHTNIRKKIYREKFSCKDFAHFLEKLGVNMGDTIFVPSSWGEFYNFQGNVKDLIFTLIEVVGESGNLAMPSNTNLFSDNQLFNIKRTPTNAGIVAEYFRRMKGVKRSIHLNSSVCVFGPDADEIVSGHENSKTAWDESSPHYRLYKSNAKIVALGCGYFFSMGTPWHCVDSQLVRDNSHFQSLYSKKIHYNWIDVEKNSGSSICYVREKESDLKFLNKYIQDVPHINQRLSNLKAYQVEIKPLVDRGIQLAKQGITLYGKY